MNEYEVIINLRKNATYSDGTCFPVTYILFADNIQDAKDFGWEVFKSETNSIMKREMCKVDASRI